ncbi:MAG TPA: hypothetical protein VF801_16300 [Rhodocyclaceae bacterium]
MRMLRWLAALVLASSCFAAAACEPADIGAAMEGNASSFGDLRSMVTAMQGTWAGCDDAGNAVSVTVGKGGEVEGDMAKYWTARADYANCRWTGIHNYSLESGGRFGFVVKTVACAGTPDARDWEHTDTGELFAFGGAGRIDYMIVSVKAHKYAVVRKAK